MGNMRLKPWENLAPRMDFSCFIGPHSKNSVRPSSLWVLGIKP